MAELEAYCGMDMEYPDTSCKGRLSLSFLEGGLVESKCDGVDLQDDYCGTQYDYEGNACVEDNKNRKTKCIKGGKCSSGYISDLTLEQLNHNLQVLQNYSANYSALINDAYDACDEDDQACMVMTKFYKEFYGETIKNNITTMNKIIGEIGEIIDIRKSEEQTKQFNKCETFVRDHHGGTWNKCCKLGDEGDKKCQEKMGAGYNCVTHDTYGSLCGNR